MARKRGMLRLALLTALLAVHSGPARASFQESLPIRVWPAPVLRKAPREKGRLAVVLEQVKEGFAEDLQASYVELIAGSLKKPLTLGVVGHPTGRDGRPWLSDPMHELLGRFKPFAQNLEFAVQGYSEDAKQTWWTDGHGHFRDVQPSDISSALSRAMGVISKVFGYVPTTYMPPVILNDQTSGALASHLEATAQSHGLTLVVPVLNSSKSGGCKGKSLLMQQSVVRTNNVRSDQCGFSNLDEVRKGLRHQMEACGAAVLVLSPLDLAGRALLSGTCGGKLSSLIDEMSAFLRELEGEEGYELVKMCELSKQPCAEFGGFPAWLGGWRVGAVWGIYGLIIISVLFSLLSSLANWLLLGSCLSWAVRLRESGNGRFCAFVVMLLATVLLFAYLLAYFVFSFLPGGTQLFLWKPLDSLDSLGASRDDIFKVTVLIFCLPLFLILWCSFRSHRQWQRWSKEGDRFDQLLRHAPRRPHEPRLHRAVVVVPVYQEDWRAFGRMLYSATHSNYADGNGEPLFEVLVVFDGDEKNGVRLERTCHCRDVLRRYVRADSRQEQNVHLHAAGGLTSVPYISGVDPETHVRIHAITPPWGGKWSAQRYAWCMLQHLKQTDALLLCIDSDCAVKPDSMKTLARCMHEKPEIKAVAGHIKVDMRNQRFNFLWKVQECDFLISQMTVRGCEDHLGAVSCLPGAFCMIRWEAFSRVQERYFQHVQSRNNWDIRRVHIAEDRYLTYLILGSYPNGAVRYCPLAEASTECPGQIQMLATQRKRWYLSALVNDIPMCLEPSMWQMNANMMRLHVWTVIMSSVPANSFHVALLSVLGMYLRDREPDLTLFIITVVPLYLFVMYYCLATQRRGPILYYWAYLLIMPLFNMCMGIYAFLYPVNQFVRPLAGGGADTLPGVDENAGVARCRETLLGVDDDVEAADRKPSRQVQSLPAHGSREHGPTSFGNISAASWTFGAFTSGNPHAATLSWRDGLAAVPLRAPPDHIEVSTFHTDMDIDPHHNNDPRLRPGSHLAGINFFRYLAAGHVVLFHYYKTYPSNPFGFINPEHQHWISWGGQWIQFFFMLSGFVMTYSRLCKPARAERWYSVWLRQMSAVYPAYLSSILMSVTLLFTQPGSFKLYWRTLPATLLLIFNWYPQETCFEIDPRTHLPSKNPSWYAWFCVEGLNEPAWYLGALQAYWLLFPHMYNLVSRISQRRVVLLLAVSWGLCLFWPFYLALSPTPEEGSWLRTLQEFHPVSHFHKFVFGMCVARLFVDLFCREDPTRPGKFVSQAIVDRNVELWLFVPIALIVISLMFLTGDVNDFMFLGLSSYEFILLPVFALLVVGLGLQASWISWLLSCRPFCWADSYDMTYEIYILQGWTFTWCGSLSLEMRLALTWQRAIYPVLLLVASLATKRYLSKRA